MTQAPAKPQEERGLVTYSTARGKVNLSMAQVKAYLSPMASDAEVWTFLQVCRYQGLNPWLREAYLVKYDREKPASIVVGKETFTQRAEAHQEFDGFTAGVIVQRGNDQHQLEGTVTLPGDALVGGWAQVWRKDRRAPFVITVGMAEYQKAQSTWKTMPATMIRKVALVQALREAFPATFTGLHDGAEVDVEPELRPAAQVVDARPQRQPHITEVGRDLQAEMERLGWSKEQLRDWVKERYDGKGFMQLAREQQTAVVAALQAVPGPEDQPSDDEDGFPF